jgi:catechol 2,3-dioxygenase-like lactoylglutathione lyase family enzyme
MTRNIGFGIAMVVFSALATGRLSAQGDATPSVRASRVILRVSDLDGSTAFYRDRVGLKLLSLNEEFAVFDGGGMALMLEHLPKPPAGPSTGLAAFTEVVLESADVFATYRAMQARGVAFRIEPRAVTSDDSRILYATDFRDPNGHIISIMGWVGREKK